MIINCTQSLSNTRTHQFQLNPEDDNNLIDSYGFANVGSMNGHPSNQRLKVEDEDNPSYAWLLITWDS